jgi:polyferredoxin
MSAPPITPAADPAGDEGGQRATHEHLGGAGGSDRAYVSYRDEGGSGQLIVAGEDGELVVVTQGMPPWLMGVGLALVILLTFLWVEARPAIARGEKARSWRINLLQTRFAYALVKSRWFQVLPQLVSALLFCALIYVGLAGNRIGNVTPIAVWTIWWAGLVFSVALLGPVFCFVCPWDGIASWITRFPPWRRVEPLTLGLEVPKRLRTVYPAIGAFVLLTWAELGLGITTDPVWTAYLALAMVAGAVAFALLFRKKAFCNYVCPVGRITGIYANFAPIELRARDPEICRTCPSQDCFKGGRDGYACPTRLSLRVLDDASMCTGCTECVKSCHSDNVAIQIRPFARDLMERSRFKSDEAWLCLMLLSLTLFHGFSMTTLWESYLPGQWSVLRAIGLQLGTSPVVSFTIAMTLAMMVPLQVYAWSVRLGAWWSGTNARTSGEMFTAYAYSLLPIALFYHLAHNAMHILMEGASIIPALSDPLGRGWDLFGTRDFPATHMLSDETIWIVQIALIVVGHVAGVVVGGRIARRLFPTDARARFRTQIPQMVVMMLLSGAALALMAMDMNMRVGRM